MKNGSNLKSLSIVQKMGHFFLQVQPWSKPKMQPEPIPSHYLVPHQMALPHIETNAQMRLDELETAIMAMSPFDQKMLYRITEILTTLQQSETGPLFELASMRLTLKTAIKKGL
jgi:hypothetical protein